MNEHDHEYSRLLRSLLGFAGSAEERTDRTGVGTRGIFGAQMRFDLDETFPLLTSKSVHWKSVVHELLWIMNGDTNVKYLQDNGVRIWNEWADENGDLGPVYGKQWRNWEYHDGEKVSHVDQLAKLVESLKNSPDSRRHIVSAWNPAQVDSMALPPCHTLFQFYVSQRDNSLSCQLYQRSADIFLGVPFNIASYSLLTCILADTLGFKRGQFVWTGGDVHLYKNHVEQAREQLMRLDSLQPLPPSPKLLHIDKLNDPLGVKFEDIQLVDYNPLSRIRADVAV